MITGPANAEKAGVVLGRLRDLLDREPILVVPTSPDVDRYRRELADDPRLVFGPRVERFDRLLSEIARRSGVGGSPLGRLARERVAAAAASDAKLELLAGSAATPGFAAAACALFDELEAERITPQRLVTALRAWAAEDEARGPFGEELGRLYGAYRRRLERLGRMDATLRHVAALDALREDGSKWGGTPVLLYGFDDLNPLQRDAVLTLAQSGAEVVVSLAYEAGRHAFAARGATFHALAPVADETIVLEANAAHYGEGSREALHHLERRLFEEDAGVDLAVAAVEPEPPAPDPEPAFDEPLTLFDDLAARSGVEDPPGSAISLARTTPPASALVPVPAARVDPGDAIVFLEGGGERAELELVAVEVARLLADGFAPEEIAVVLRKPDEAAALVVQVFGAYGVPVALEQRTQLGHTALGRGLVALLRAATGGTAQDLLAYLRTPGRIRTEHWVDELEVELRQTGVRAAADARAVWE
ncbi:MAG TPA: hypothetical protein VN238_03965, partial [Solirubrobacteraceae bacterium]|nr:hypothetical protein [Solirubrobacteraceae bacterium]